MNVEALASDQVNSSLLRFHSQMSLTAAFLYWPITDNHKLMYVFMRSVPQINVLQKMCYKKPCQDYLEGVYLVRVFVVEQTCLLGFRDDPSYPGRTETSK